MVTVVTELVGVILSGFLFTLGMKAIVSTLLLEISETEENTESTSKKTTSLIIKAMVMFTMSMAVMTLVIKW